MGSYYVALHQGALPATSEWTYSTAGSFPADGPGEIQGVKVGSNFAKPEQEARSVTTSYYPKYHVNSDSSFIELRLTTDQPGTISFYRRVESEGCCDFYRFFIDGAQQEALSGFAGWARVEYQIGPGDHVFRWQFTTDGSVLSGISGYRLANVEVSSANPNPAYSGNPQGFNGAAAGGGGGGGSKGTGNMLGGFALGSTMLGADPGSGSGSGGGSGIGNMLGGFQLGQTMLGADPGGGGDGDAAPIAVGAIFPVAGAIAGLANVSGAFATFIYPVAARSDGVAVAQNAYLNAPWSVAGSTANHGKIRYFANEDATGFPAIEAQEQTVSITSTFPGNAFNGTGVQHQFTVYSKTTNRFVRTDTRSIATVSSSYTTAYDAGAGNYVGQIRVVIRGNLSVFWDWQSGPHSAVSATIFSPIGLRSTFETGATVTGDMSVHILDGDTCSGSADVTADAGRILRVRSQPLLAGANVVGEITNLKDLAGTTSTGDSSITSDLVQVYFSHGTSSATGDLELHLLDARNKCAGVATVRANLRRNEGFQGDSIGDAEDSKGTLRQAIPLSTASVGSATLRADLTYPLDLGTGVCTGVATVTSTLAVYTVRGKTSVGDSEVTGAVRYAGFLRIAGSPMGEATVVSDFRVRGRLKVEPIIGESTAVADKITRVWFVEAKPAGEASVSGMFDIYTIPAGPIKGEATVVSETVGAFKFAGRTAEILRDPKGEPVLDAKGNEQDEPGRSGAKVVVTYISTTTSFTGGTSQGDSFNRGRLYSLLQDMPESFINGSAAVIGQVLISSVDMRATSRGGLIDNREEALKNGQPPNFYPLRDDKGALRDYGYGTTLVTGFLPLAAAFEGVVRAFGEASFTFAILLLNDSGLISGNSRAEATMDYASRNYRSKSNGFSVNRGQFDFASDLKGKVTDAYAGVGKWFPDGFARIYHFDYAIRFGPLMRPIEDTPEHSGKPGDAVRHGGTVPFGSGVDSDRFKTVDSYIDGHIWDGTYEEWTANDVPGLSLEQFPELIDPETKRPYPKFPGPLRRKYQLLQPGKPGTWMVDTRGPGFMDKAMRAEPVGEARFDEPQSTVDMDLELKSSMRGRIVGDSTVVAMALLLSFKTLNYTGNVTLLKVLTTALTGNLAKSPEALVPMNRDNADFLVPVNQTNALYV